MIKKIGLAIVAPVVAFTFAVGVAVLALLAVGVNPIEAFGLMWDFASTPTSVASIITRSVAVYVGAAGVAVGVLVRLVEIAV